MRKKRDEAESCLERLRFIPGGGRPLSETSADLSALTPTGRGPVSHKARWTSTLSLSHRPREARCAAGAANDHPTPADIWNGRGTHEWRNLGRSASCPAVRPKRRNQMANFLPAQRPTERNRYGWRLGRLSLSITHCVPGDLREGANGVPNRGLRAKNLRAGAVRRVGGTGCGLYYFGPICMSISARSRRRCKKTTLWRDNIEDLRLNLLLVRQ